MTKEERLVEIALLALQGNPDFHDQDMIMVGDRVGVIYRAHRVTLDVRFRRRGPLETILRSACRLVQGARRP